MQLVVWKAQNRTKVITLISSLFPGYTGTKCNECKSGYFGNPNQVGGECKKCDCEPYGSTGSDCDPTTGICICKKGLTGPRCDTCVAARHEFVHDICQRKFS